MKQFASFEEYEMWTEQFEDASDYQEIPCIIDDGWKVSADMFTACKSYKTALRRFEKAFKGVNGEISGWVECMTESCEGGCFKDVDGWRPAWTNDPAEASEFAKNGMYSWGVEETMEGYWYVYLNISGIYAGRQAQETEAETEEDDMDNKKVVETIEKKLEVKVLEVLEVRQDGREVTADVKVGAASYRKVVLREAGNQHGTYYRLVSASEYEMRGEPDKEAKKPSRKPRTKTERLCGAGRMEIISFAEKSIGKVADGSARIKEIEGAALGDTVIRFVLLMNADGSRFKEDIAVSRIREAVAI